MRRILEWLTRITAFRIGLFTGLAFAALYVLQLAGRAEVPVLTRMEGALADVRFAQRVGLFGSAHSGQVVVAAATPKSPKDFPYFYFASNKCGKTLYAKDSADFNANVIPHLNTC